ncbi:MAG TPA: glycosyltransferase [Chryseolinea sp.]|nr:glycosyltransferase [Chryseolinea sp.]
MNDPRYSIVIPVYNRPQEVSELLASLTLQTNKNFEVIIVEDGSTVRCDQIVDQFRDLLSIQYFFKPNSGPGPSRNFGFGHARGDYFIVFDSDCIIPLTYVEVVEKSIQANAWDAWGGPDKAHEDFTVVQRAMGYTMVSVLITGGIRGGEKRLGWFQPRSYNMGLSRTVFAQTGGFKFSHFAEDIELSIRMKKSGFKIGLITDAFVYHKRRTTFKQFFRQVFNFGKGRALVGSVHPEEIKLTHWFPTLFLLGTIGVLLLPLLSMALFKFGAAMFLLYLLAIFLHSLKENKNLTVAILSIPSALLQLWGYGLGFLNATIKSKG